MAGRDVPPKVSAIERWRRLRKTMRAHSIAFAAGYHETSFQRSNFLSSKQLIYLERYGRMYVPEHAILGDREFLETVVAALRVDAGADAAS